MIAIQKTKFDDIIYKDITRTFPDVALLKDHNKKGMQMLFNVLKALSIRFPEIGYV